MALKLLIRYAVYAHIKFKASLKIPQPETMSSIIMHTLQYSMQIIKVTFSHHNLCLFLVSWIAECFIYTNKNIENNVSVTGTVTSSILGRCKAAVVTRASSSCCWRHRNWPPRSVLKETHLSSMPVTPLVQTRRGSRCCSVTLWCTLLSTNQTSKATLHCMQVRTSSIIVMCIASTSGPVTSIKCKLFSTYSLSSFSLCLASWSNLLIICML